MADTVKMDGKGISVALYGDYGNYENDGIHRERSWSYYRHAMRGYGIVKHV